MNFMNRKIPLLCSLIFSAALFGCNGGSNSNNSTTSTTNSVNTNKSSTISLQANGEISNIGNTADLHAIAYGKDVYVAVGDNGQIVTSYDTKNWEAQDSHVTMNLHAITFSEKLQKFYAVGDDGYVLSSSDGIKWEVKFPLNPSVALYSVMSVGNGIVIGGKNGVVFELTVGARGSETIVKRDVPGVGNVTAMTYFGDKMLLATSNGSIFTKLYSVWSVQNWTKVTTLSNSAINSLSYDMLDDMIIGANAAGEVFSSTNGQEWSKPIKISNYPIHDLILDDVSNDFIAAGGDPSKALILSSNNFNTWNTITSSLNKDINSLRCFNTGGTSCVSVGDGGQIGYVINRDPISHAMFLDAANTVKNNAVALLSEPDSLDYTSDRLFNIQQGGFGLKSYRVTNVNKGSTLTIQSINLPNDSEVSYDYTRATCFNGKGSSAKAITKLAYGDSCTIVYKYQPVSYQPASWFQSYATFKDQNGTVVDSNLIKTPYSSVGN